MIVCKLDRLNCASKLTLYNNETSVKLETLGTGAVRCNIGVSNDKWYWETKRDSYCVFDGSVYPHVHTSIQMGLISEDINQDWDNIGGFNDHAGWPGISSGVGIQYLTLDKYGGLAPEFNQSAEITGTSVIGTNGIVVLSTTTPEKAKSMYTEQSKAIGFMLDLDNSKITICTGNTNSLDSTNSANSSIPLGKVYYPAVALWNDSQANLNTYGPLDVQYNFGESGPFELGLPDGYKPYYMAYKYSYDDLKIY